MSEEQNLREASERLSACVQKSRAFVTQCLHEAQKQGELRADLPVETLVPIVLGTIQMLALSTANAKQRAIKAQEVRKGLLVLLRPPSPARSASRKKSPR